MQKKKQKQNNVIKQIILYALVVIIAILLTFAEDIAKLANKNKVGLLENTPDEITVAEPNIPILSAGMIPIKWETDHYVITTMDDNDWYDYKSGKPAYIMLNDGVYQSELVRNMEANGQKLADENVGNDALVVPDNPNNNPTILMWIPRFAINNETNDIKYIKDIETAEEGWTIPEMFTYKQEKETAPDFLLTGIWFEKDVDTNYTNKIKQMNQEESIYGFIANTKAVPSDQTTGNTIQNYYNTLIANTVGASIARPQIDDITNSNRVILKIINQKNQDPIKAKGEYNKNTGLITVQVTYSQYGIEKILYENTSELKLTKNGRQATATSEGIDVEDGERTITIIDNNGNKKEIKVQVMSAIYATIYKDGTLAFGKNENPLPEKTIWIKYGDISGKDYYQKNTPWYNERGSITTVEFVNKISPISTARWFYYCNKLTNIINIENLNTSNVTNMLGMFYNCSVLTTLDLRTFDTKNVTNMASMFDSCERLTQLDVSSFNTSKVTDMSYMFNRCSYYSESGLEELDVSNFDTSNVTNMTSMFAQCTGVSKLDVSNFNTSKVTNMANMFSGWEKLTELDVSNFDTSNVTNMYNMFVSCSALTSLDLSSFDTSKVTNINYIFTNCTSLSQIRFGEKWDKQVTLPTLTKPCTGWHSDAEFTNKVAEAGANYTPAGPITIYANVPPDIYVKLYTDGTLAFCSNNSQIPFKELSNDYGNTGGKEYNSTNPPWYDNGNDIKTVNIVNKISPISTARWFSYCTNLNTIENIANLDTSRVNNMVYMFGGCSSLTSVDVSHFDTSKVTSMASMFFECSNLTELDVSNFDTRKVTNMASMFRNCNSLTTLDISKFDTSNVTDMGRMFDGCTSLTQITFGEKWNKQVTLPTPTKEGYTCTGWYSDAEFTNKVAYAGANYTPTGPITIYAQMAQNIYATLYSDGTLGFASNTKLITGKTKQYGPWNIINQTGDMPWYSYRTRIKTVEFVDKVAPISTERWFYDCENLTNINNIENLNTSNVTSMNYMFYFCFSLTGLDVSNFDISNVKWMYGMFFGCTNLTTLDVSNFDTSNVTSMGSMFNSCKSLKSLDVSNFDTSNVKDMSGMFSGCKSLKSLDVSNFDTSNVTDMSSMFNVCSSLTSLDVGNFNTSNVTTMNHMFYYCSSLNTIYVGENWTTDNATTTDMFTGCGTSTVTRK